MKGGQKAAENGNQDAHGCFGIFRPVFIQKRTHQARDAAHIHDAGNAEIEVSGLFRHDLARGPEENRDSLYDGPLNESK